MAISNDSEFKTALDTLSAARQRLLAALFTERVLYLCNDVRVAGAISAAKRPDITDVELSALHQAVKTVSIESYTQCGHETDWMAQAGHFVAKAAMACMQPAGPGTNLAWDAAMASRVARTCEAITSGQGTANSEAETQYRLSEEYLKQ